MYIFFSLYYISSVPLIYIYIYMIVILNIAWLFIWTSLWQMQWVYKMILTNPTYFVEWQMSWVRPQIAGLDLKIGKNVTSDWPQ